MAPSPALPAFGLVERCVDGQPRQHAACRPHLLGVGSHPVPEASCALEADLHRTIANGRLGAALAADLPQVRPGPVRLDLVPCRRAGFQVVRCNLLKPWSDIRVA
jgi:hypothetical protein